VNLTARRRRLVAAAALLLLLAGIGAAVWLLWPDAHLAHAQELRRQLADESARTLSADQRRDLRRQLGEEMRQLSPDQRRKLWGDQRGRFKEQLDKFFKMSKQEQTAFLDQQIDRMEQARRQRERERAGQGHGGGQQANGAGFGGWRPTGPDERERRRRERLDQATPEERAQFAEFFQQLNARRQQRGIPGGGFGGRP
jgi:hypothetical protein